MELQVTERTQLGKSVKHLRVQGLIPAEFYGRGMENKHFAVGAKDFRKVFKAAGEHTVIHLVFGEKKAPALVHDVQHDRISGDPIHVDFHGVRMDEKIKAPVPLEFTGEAPAVKTAGAVLTKTVSELEVEALPGDLPPQIIVDLTRLNAIGESLYVKDLSIPKGVEVLVDPETVIVTASEPAKEEEIPAAPVDVSTVAVETEEKAKERAAQKAEEGEVKEG